MGEFLIQVEREKKHGTVQHVQWILFSEECSRLTGEQKKILIRGIWQYPKQILKFPLDGEYQWTPNGSRPKLKKRK